MSHLNLQSQPQTSLSVNQILYAPYMLGKMVVGHNYSLSKMILPAAVNILASGAALNGVLGQPLSALGGFGLSAAAQLAAGSIAGLTSSAPPQIKTPLDQANYIEADADILSANLNIQSDIATYAGDPFAGRESGAVLGYQAGYSSAKVLGKYNEISDPAVKDHIANYHPDVLTYIGIS